MKIAYDPQRDILRILFTNAPIDRSRAALPGVVFDYDDRDGIVGLEVRDASYRVHNPHLLECSGSCVAHHASDEESLRLLLK